MPAKPAPKPVRGLRAWASPELAKECIAAWAKENSISLEQSQAELVLCGYNRRAAQQLDKAKRAAQQKSKARKSA